MEEEKRWKGKFLVEAIFLMEGERQGEEGGMSGYNKTGGIKFGFTGTGSPVSIKRGKFDEVRGVEGVDFFLFT